MEVLFRLKPEFKTALELKGLNQHKLAKLTGYWPTAISMMLNGKRAPSWQFLRKVAQVTGFRAENIIETIFSNDLALDSVKIPGKRQKGRR